MTQTELRPLLLTVPEFCALVRLSRSKAYELFGAGTVRVVRVGSAVRVPYHEAERFARSLEAQ